jgi:hypothetical protein
MSDIKVRVGQQNSIKVVSSLSGSQSLSLSQLSDVNIINPLDGQILAYNESTGKWDSGYIDGGSY